jgi:hypothetical protein
MLEEIKKMSEGKNRIDAKVFYDCISTAFFIQITNALFPFWSV